MRDTLRMYGVGLIVTGAFFFVGTIITIDPVNEVLIFVPSFAILIQSSFTSRCHAIVTVLAGWKANWTHVRLRVMCCLLGAWKTYYHVLMMHYITTQYATLRSAD